MNHSRRASLARLVDATRSRRACLVRPAQSLPTRVELSQLARLARLTGGRPARLAGLTALACVALAPACYEGGLDLAPGSNAPTEACQVLAPGTCFPLRVATFNASNLFNDRLDSGPATGDEARHTPGTREYRARLAGVARVLAWLDAQVVMLQEIENRAVLDELASFPQLGRVYPHRILVEGNDPRGIDLALLSTLPILRQRTHQHDWFPRRDLPGGERYHYARDCLEVHLRIGGVRVILLGVHFRSKRRDDPQQRLAEAQHTRLIADTLAAEYPEAGIIILGDFNDVPGSRTMLAIEGSPPDCVCWGPAYLSAGQLLAPDHRWTVRSSAAPDGVALHDDLLASPVLAASLDPTSLQVLHDTDLPPDLRNVSDHAPIAATYWVKAE